MRFCVALCFLCRTYRLGENKRGIVLICGVYKVEHTRADDKTFASAHTRFWNRPCSIYTRVESYDMNKCFLSGCT